MKQYSHATSDSDQDMDALAANGSNLVVRSVGDEVIVYSRETHRAFCLNKILAEVWRAASKNENPEQLVQRLQESEMPQANRETVCYALNLLESHDLLHREKYGSRTELPTVSRRDCLRALGAGAAAIVPTLAAIDVPEAFAQASECGQQNAPCGPGFPPCCPGKVCQRTGQGRKCVG